MLLEYVDKTKCTHHALSGNPLASSVRMSILSDERDFHIHLICATNRRSTTQVHAYHGYIVTNKDNEELRATNFVLAGRPFSQIVTANCLLYSNHCLRQGSTIALLNIEPLESTFSWTRSKEVSTILGSFPDRNNSQAVSIIRAAVVSVGALCTDLCQNRIKESSTLFMARALSDWREQAQRTFECWLQRQRLV
jgi:hypothetical protein